MVAASKIHSTYTKTTDIGRLKSRINRKVQTENETNDSRRFASNNDGPLQLLERDKNTCHLFPFVASYSGGQTGPSAVERQVQDRSLVVETD